MNKDGDGRLATLKAGLNDADENIRLFAARSLQQSHDAVATVNAILNQLATENHEPVYAELLLSLGNYKDLVPEAKDYLEKQSKANDSQYKDFIAEALER